MVELTLELLVDIAGDYSDDSTSAERFRDILQDEQTTSEEVEQFLNEALNGSESYHNRALQDIINNIGQRLGFTVEYGPYQGTTNNIGNDGLWTSNAGEGVEDVHLVVETKKSTAYTIDPGQAGGYMEELADDRDFHPSSVYGLYVIGDDDVETVVSTIRGSEYRDRIRSIPASQLLTLLEIQEESGLQHEQILNLLLPLDTINVGSLVELVQDVIEFREPTSTGGHGPGRGANGWTPEVNANAVVGQMSRSEIDGSDDAKVAIFPSRDDGIPFLEENNAWGFVRINQNPEFVGMYITGDVGAVKYVAQVKEIVPAEEATLARSLESYVGDQANFDRDKRVVIFEPSSLYELSDPIPLETRVPYGLRYTDLGSFRTAETTDDIL